MIIVVEIDKKGLLSRMQGIRRPFLQRSRRGGETRASSIPHVSRYGHLGSKTIHKWSSEKQRKSGDLGPASVVKADRDPDKLSLARGG